MNLNHDHDQQIKDIALQLSAYAFAARRLGHQIHSRLYRGLDKGEAETIMRQSGNVAISGYANLAATNAAEKTLKDQLTPSRSASKDWCEFQFGNHLIFFASHSNNESQRKIDTRIHNTIFHSAQQSDHPSIFDLDTTITDHRFLSYEEKGLRASCNTSFCQLLTRVGPNGLLTSATISALTVVADQPLFTYELDLEEIEAVAQKLIEDKAPELEFLFTMLENSSSILQPAGYPQFPAVPDQDIRRPIDTATRPEPAPLPDESKSLEEEA